MLPVGVERVSPVRTWDVSGGWWVVVPQSSREGEYFSQMLMIGVTPHQSPLLVVLELPDVIRGTPV